MTKPLEQVVAKKLHCRQQEIKELVIVRRSIDARRKPHIYFVFTVDVKLADENKVWPYCQGNKDVRRLEEKTWPPVQTGTRPLAHRPVVVGTGPSGLAAALELARHGYQPVVYERGCDVDTRAAHVEEFWQTGYFRPESNVQFGEGGAGTFSDGKLTTRVNHPLLPRILQAFVDAGAPEEIRYAYNPHVGTDVLRRVVRNMRQTIEKLGGTIHFNSCVTGITRAADGHITAVTINGTETVETDVVIMGIGHSARDTYYMLYDQGLRWNARTLLWACVLNMIRMLLTVPSMAVPLPTWALMRLIIPLSITIRSAAVRAIPFACALAASSWRLLQKQEVS